MCVGRAFKSPPKMGLQCVWDEVLRALFVDHEKETCDTSKETCDTSKETCDPSKETYNALKRDVPPKP